VIPHEKFETLRYKNGALLPDGKTFIGNHGPFAGKNKGHRNSIAIIKDGIETRWTSKHITNNTLSKLHWCHNGKGPEDPRYVEFNGEMYILYFDGVQINGELKSRIFISKISDMSNRFAIALKGVKLNACEKNWTPWVLDGKLYISYTLTPTHTVYQLDPSTGVGTHVATTSFSFRPISGGSSALPHDGKMIGIGHYKDPGLSKHMNAFYKSVFYEFEDHYPYSILRVSNPFVFNKKHWCEFVTELSYDKSIKKFRINYGVNDITSMLAFVDPFDIPWNDDHEYPVVIGEEIDIPLPVIPTIDSTVMMII
jgi:hypothetical protein